MPSTIPYDSTLVLGNIVPLEKLNTLKNMSDAQVEADAAEEELNQLFETKRSIDMTLQEILNMGIDTKDLDPLKEQSNNIKNEIKATALDYAQKKIAAAKKLSLLKRELRLFSSTVESPIDYAKTEIKSMPLSTDSIKMNCQYFAFDEGQQDADAHAGTISSFVGGSITEGFGGSSKEYAGQVKSSTQYQVSSQHEKHTISGTLVITITCTHRQAAILEPCVIDPDKAVSAWNTLFPDNNKIKTESRKKMEELLTALSTGDANKLEMHLLSGQTCGSCFIGMVHTLDVTQTDVDEKLYATARNLQAKFKVGKWFSGASGSFGLDKSFSDDARHLLSAQNVSSHCSLTVLGVIPSIKSNTIKMAIKAFDDADDKNAMSAVVKIQNATAGYLDTIETNANAAMTGKQLQGMKSAKIEAVLGSLSKIDNENNKMIDTASLMDAMEDYLTKCSVEGAGAGVPINFYLKPITKAQIVQLWLSKYYPKPPPSETEE